MPPRSTGAAPKSSAGKIGSGAAKIKSNENSGSPSEAPRDCTLCPRLVAYRRDNARLEPNWFNAPVPSFGDSTAQLLIAGLAPGRQGANRTGRPFTGDYAGDLLFATLSKFDLAKGTYAARIDDGFTLVDCMISNAVRCVPPENKPTPEEIRTCRRFFSARMQALPNLRIILALGRIAHDQVLATLKLKRSDFPFAHGAQHDIGNGRLLFDSFHCSRYNTNTRRLTVEMFEAVFAEISRVLAR